jgi:hypothetical protein
MRTVNGDRLSGTGLVAAVQGPRPEVATPAGVGCCDAGLGGSSGVLWGWWVSGQGRDGAADGGERCGCCNRRLRYRWRQFEAGHEVRLEHGAWIEPRVDPLAAELAAALLEDRPELAVYPESVRAWARAEARLVLFEDFHARNGFLDADGGVRGGGRVREYEVLAANLRARLGLDPVSDVQLQKARAEAVHLVADLEGVRERGRAVLERRRAELAAGGRAQGETGTDGP